MTTANPALSAVLQKLERAASRDALAFATRELAALAFSLQDEPAQQQQAILELTALLRSNNPGAALAAVQGLVRCGTPAVVPLLKSLNHGDYGARAWAVRALATIGDPRGVEVLLRAVGNDIGPSVRQAAARGLGGLRQGELTDAAFSDLQNRCLDGLLLACSDEEWVVRYAAMVGLEGLLGQGLGTDERAKARAQLQRHGSGRSNDTLVVRLRAQQALERQP